MFIYNSFLMILWEQFMFIYNSFMMILLEHLNVLICIVCHVALQVIKELKKLRDKEFNEKWSEFQMRKEVKQKAGRKK